MGSSLTHTKLVRKVNTFLEKYQSDMNYCHGYDHVRRVARLAVKIGTIEKADCQIIEIAALLHDIGLVSLAWARQALGKDENDYQDFITQYLLDSNDHGRIGAGIARRFLEQTGYHEDRIKQITLIISEHPTITQTTAESRAVADADKLDALGATWVARAFQRTNAFDRSIGIESIPQKYFKGKERFLDHFYSESAKEMALQRYRFLTDFNEQFQKEMNLEA
ncbi:HD domain-containing protein [Chloroflexota bacterium]